MAFVGDTLNIKCLSSRTQIWRKNGLVILNAHTLGNHLVLSGVTQKSTGIYSCSPQNEPEAEVYVGSKKLTSNLSILS